MKYSNVDIQIKKMASEIVFSASVLEGVPYTVCWEIDNAFIFVNVEAHRSVFGTTNYSVKISLDGYGRVAKRFRDTPPAVRFLATYLAKITQ